MSEQLNRIEDMLGQLIKIVGETNWLNDYTFKTRAEAKKAVFEYIELFYNRRRTHSSNDYVPPFLVGEEM